MPNKRHWSALGSTYLEKKEIEYIQLESYNTWQTTGLLTGFGGLIIQLLLSRILQASAVF